MIIGIGTDIIEIARIDKALKRTKGFLVNIFTEKEIQFFESKGMRVESVAGNFAAKEAISKALGTGVRGFNLKDIEILRDELGKPIAYLSPKIESLIGINRYKVNISISHNQTSAIAFAVLEDY